MRGAVQGDRLRAYVTAYRVMAYITGVLIIVICFVGLPLQFAADNNWIDKWLGTVHGYLYIVYVIVAYLLGSIPFGYILVRLFKKQDIRQTGSGNIPFDFSQNSVSVYLAIGLSDY